MVRIDRIVMENFKSFAGRVLIPFPRGFNVICGPNGAGKSNIVDALSFILGTSSAKSIRAHRLHNLIFNGSKNRKAADFCSVSIYIDNSSRKIPGYEDEIKLTRKITRSGVSVFKINGRNETKSKVMELLMNANLSSDNSNIIKQGDVTKIIEMNPIERRCVIDKISGISEFDDKKEKAYRELEKVETRARESMIIIVEKQRYVNRLKQEKENAEKYIKLSNELKKAKASLLHAKITEHEKKLKELEKDINEDAKKLAELDKKFEKAEKDIELKEADVKTISMEMMKGSKYYEISGRINRLQNEMLRKKDRIELNERQIATFRDMQSDRNLAVKSILEMNNKNVFGTVLMLLDVEPKYSTAIDVIMGMHANDIIVADQNAAGVCINYLKDNRIGRARFLPLDKIGGKKKKIEKQGGVIGHALDIIRFDKKYTNAMNFVFGNSIIVDNIETAKKIDGYRIATLDGDLKEPSGAMTGGYYIKKEKIRHAQEIRKLAEENELLEQEIELIKKELENLKRQEKEESEDVQDLRRKMDANEKEIDNIKAERKKIYEKRMILQNNVGKKKVEKAKTEAILDNLNAEFKEFADVKEFMKMNSEKLQERIRQYLIEINKLGPVNMKAIDEYKTINVEFLELKKKLENLLEEKNAVENTVKEIEKKRYDKFMETFKIIDKSFSKIYKDLVDGEGNLRLEEDDNIDSGLIIEASPPGKKIVNLDSMSGGERTLTSLCFLFSVMQYYAAPFYVLDEVDAALDKANTKKIVELIKKYSNEVQFIVITHNDATIGDADKVFGVSMENGVSKIIGIKMPER